MSLAEALIQGLVQGITEMLPISSSGHLSLFRYFFGSNDSGSLFFSVVLHLGTITAVVAVFWERIKELIIEAFRVLRDIFTGKFRFGDMDEKRRMLMMLITASLPLAVFYLFRDFVERISTDDDIIVEGICFLITAVMLFLFSRKKDGLLNAADMTVKDALIIGIAQGAAIMPGISRSGSTISAGALRGYSKDFVVAFSFILGIPAVLGAASVETLHAVKTETIGEPVMLAVGFITSALAGFIAIKLIIRLIKTGRFAIFAYYLFAIGAVSVILGVLGIKPAF